MKNATIIILATMLSISCVSNKRYKILEESVENALVTPFSNELDETELETRIKKLEEEIHNLSKLRVSTTQNDMILSSFWDDLESIDIENEESPDGIECEYYKVIPISELNSGARKFSYSIKKNDELKFNLLGLGGSKLSKNQKISVIDYVEYTELKCNNKVYRYAAGVRLKLTITTKNKNFNIEIPSKVAAAVEFGAATAEYTLETIGFSNTKTRNILSNLGGEFDMDDYIKVINAVSNLQKCMNDLTTVKAKIIPRGV